MFLVCDIVVKVTLGPGGFQILVQCFRNSKYDVMIECHPVV